MATTEVRQSIAVPIGVAAVVTGLGLVLGFVGPWLARAVASLLERTPIPVHQVIEILAGMSRGWSLGILVPLGVIVGLVLAVSASKEALHLDVDDEHLEASWGERRVWVERSQVAAVFRDGRDLVVVDGDGRVRMRPPADDVSAKQLRQALVAHGYPWRDTDPRDDEFIDWVDGRPDFTDAEHGQLRALERATKKPDNERVAEELAEAGLVTRRRDGRTQVRRVAHGSHG